MSLNFKIKSENDSQDRSFSPADMHRCIEETANEVMKMIDELAARVEAKRPDEDASGHRVERSRELSLLCLLDGESYLPSSFKST
mmetsp:Transcript_24814/g.50903  ORF Transcript_24814/g.50903 Transcript_24814/m.50903 type:complete len:85 (+) Transcript_24814:39-293(+)